MRLVDRIIVHDSETLASEDIGVKELDRLHRAKGFLRVGYHYVIRRDGEVEKGRALSAASAVAAAYNATAVSVCLVGGKGRANFTDEQYVSLRCLVSDLLKAYYPKAQVLGQRDVGSGTCPHFNVRKWWSTT